MSPERFVKGESERTKKLPLRSQCRRGNLNIRANSGGIHNTRLLSLQRQSAKSLD
jgi:hypothetical protein